MSVVILTWNEEANIEACLRSLAAQACRDFEVIVLDAASTDRTVERVRALPGFPVPLRLEVAPTRTTIGAARNRGRVLALTDAVAFLSADAEVTPEWVAAALEGLRDADLVFGRQVHAPTRRTFASAVRGLRYHFPDGPTDEPTKYASHVNAAFRRRVLETFPFGESASASAIDDILLAHRAVQAGHRAAYLPHMVAYHHDVTTWRAELAKNRREGLALGEFSPEIGTRGDVLAWAGLLLVAIALLILSPGPWALAAALACLWLPALRRAWRRRDRMDATDLARGVAASPVFDFEFLFAYVRGLLRAHANRRETVHVKEVQT